MVFLEIRGETPLPSMHSNWWIPLRFYRRNSWPGFNSGYVRSTRWIINFSLVGLKGFGSSSRFLPSLFLSLRSSHSFFSPSAFTLPVFTVRLVMSIWFSEMLSKRGPYVHVYKEKERERKEKCTICKISHREFQFRDNVVI